MQSCAEPSLFPTPKLLPFYLYVKLWLRVSRASLGSAVCRACVQIPIPGVRKDSCGNARWHHHWQFLALCTAVGLIPASETAAGS